MVRETDSELLTDPKDVDVGSLLYIDPGNISSRERHGALWHKMLSTVRGLSIPFEVQYETFFELGYWKDIIEALRVSGLRLSLHSPIHKRDICHPDALTREWSIEETKQTMVLAHRIGASVLVHHLTPQDHTSSRESQLELGVDAFRQITEFKHQHGYRFKTLVETLEYPKWPSNIQETLAILPTLQDIDSDVGLCVDVAHLWHNAVSLRPDANQFIDFPHKLSKFLTIADTVAPIERIHFGGAYIQTNREEIHQTHAVPQLEPPVNFQGIWMHVGPVATVLKEFVQEKQLKNETVDVILEIHQPLQTQLESVDIVRTIFNSL